MTRNKKREHNQEFSSAGEVIWSKGTSIDISCETHERKIPQE